MKYSSTINIKRSDDGYYYVHAGWLDAVVGDKNNYFPVFRGMNGRETKAHGFLMGARFPDGENKHESLEQAEAWAEAYKAYADRVAQMPIGLRAGHSCEWWR